MFPMKVRQNHGVLYMYPLRDDKKRGVAGVFLMPIVFLVGSMMILVGLWEITKQRVYLTRVVIHTDHLVHRTDDRFLSIALDTSTIHDGWVHKNIQSDKLLKLAAVLAPAYLRVGGTLADRLVFQADWNFSPTEHNYSLSCAYETKGCTSQNLSLFNMSGTDWMALNRFAHAAGLQVLFDLNVLLRNGTRWDNSNARKLLDFSDRHGFNVSWQLGNEPNAFHHVFDVSVSGSQLGCDFVELRRLLNLYQRYSQAVVVGPDVTRPLSRILAEEPVSYLNSFLAEASSVISAITWHQYYLNGRKAKLKDFVSPDVMNVLACQISIIHNATTRVHGLPVWLGETGSAFGGGVPGLSDRYVAGFLWLDKLGMAARLGLAVVVRQALYGSHYGLLDQELDPLPDWWVSLLYKRLVGPGVLGVDSDNILNTSCPGAQGNVRLYCHCARQNSGVVLFGVNVLKHESHIVVSGPLMSDNVLTYVLTADVILRSRHILLNGKKLQLRPDGSLPSLEPVLSNISMPLVMPAFSMAFWVIEDVTAPACNAHLAYQNIIKQ